MWCFVSSSRHTRFWVRHPRVWDAVSQPHVLGARQTDREAHEERWGGEEQEEEDKKKAKCRLTMMSCRRDVVNLDKPPVLAGSRRTCSTRQGCGGRHVCVCVCARFFGAMICVFYAGEAAETQALLRLHRYRRDLDRICRPEILHCCFSLIPAAPCSIPPYSSTNREVGKQDHEQTGRVIIKRASVRQQLTSAAGRYHGERRTGHRGHRGRHQLPAGPLIDMGPVQTG